MHTEAADIRLSLTFSRRSWFGPAMEAAQRTDADLAMQRYAEGDESVFPVVYDALAGRLYAFLKRSTGNEAQARDLLQQTFLQLHRARGTFASDRRVLPWAFSIARRAFIDHLRATRRRPVADCHEAGENLAAEVDIESQIGARREVEAVQRDLGDLPETYRAAVELVRIDGLSMAEAAAVMGITPNAVKTSVHRAGLRLKQAQRAREERT